MLFATTRMGSKFFQLERAVRNNPAAKLLMASPSYTSKYEERVVVGRAAESDEEAEAGDGGHEGETLSSRLRAAKATIQTDSLWADVNLILDALQPTVLLLRKADSDKVIVGSVWRLLYEEHQRLQKLEQAHPRLAPIAALFAKRWKYVHHPVYSLAHVLHPAHNQMDPLRDPTIRADVTTMLKRYFQDATERASVRSSLEKYLSRQGHFSFLDDDADERDFWHTKYIEETSPWDWWNQFVQIEPLLAPMAVRVLQIGVASSPCERTFSRWAHIVNKYRTRLTLSRQHKLVYCSSNWRLMEKCKDDKWYRSDSSDEENLE